MNPSRTHADGPRDLPDRQPGLLRRHHSPDPFAFGVIQPRHGQAEPGTHLLLATDALWQGFMGFHGHQDTRFSLSWTEN